MLTTGLVEVADTDKSLTSRACLAFLLGKCFTCTCLPILFRGMAQKLYKITVSKGDICKHAKSMLSVPGMFFMASGVS